MMLPSMQNILVSELLFAVPDGLVVPVLPFTDQMSLTQIGANVKDLAGKARNKKLTPQEMSGSTFTVSN